MSGGVVTVDSWRGWCDSVYWADEGPRGCMDFRGGDVVFCKIDEVMGFFERVRLTRRRVVLVTGQGDLSCDGWRQGFLPANVVRWFATNVTVGHSGVEAWPLGLGSPGSRTTLRGEEIWDGRRQGIARDGWLYVNFRTETNPVVRGPVFDCFRGLSGEDWVTFEEPGERGDNEGFLRRILRHRFVLCPPGNGVDTHRMWEVLVAGAIPVVLRSRAMEPFEGLPILFVKDYREVTHGLLAEAWRSIQIPEVLPPLMREDFWAGEISKAKKALVGREIMPVGEWLAESGKYGFGMVGRRLRKS